MDRGSPKLQLFFAADKDHWLTKLNLVHPDLPKGHKMPRNHPDDFPWTIGIRGLCLVLLTVAQRQFESAAEESNLSFCVKDHPSILPALWEGCRPSVESKWARNIMGFGEDNAPFLRSLISAKGKGRQQGHRNDTREVRYNAEFMPPSAIEVFVDGRQLATAELVGNLIENLRPGEDKAGAAAGTPAGGSPSHQALRSFKQVEGDEFEWSKRELFPRIGQACAEGNLLLSWAEFLPCSLESDDFMRGHHESIYREVLPAPPGWREVVDWYNTFGAARRRRLEEECERGARSWKFVHMMFESDLERIATDDPEYRCCDYRVKEGCFTHLIHLLRNDNMNLQLGFVPKSKEPALRRPRWNAWRMGHDSVVLVESKGTPLLCFTRDRAWRLREVPDVSRQGAREWLNAVKDLCILERPKVVGLLSRLRTQCAAECGARTAE